MFNFYKSFLVNKKIDKYKLLILNGSNFEQKQLIIANLKEYFSIIQEVNIKNIKGDDFLIEEKLLSNSIFDDREIFLINDLKKKDVDDYLKIFTKYIKNTKNFFIFIVENNEKIYIKDDLILIINCDEFSKNEKVYFIKSKIYEYQIKVDEKLSQLLIEKLLETDLYLIDNELKKLQIAFNGENITIDNLDNLLNIEAKVEINKLIVAIISEEDDLLDFIKKLLDEYHASFIIRVLYNNFLTLFRVFFVMKINNLNFYSAINNCYIFLSYFLDNINFKENIKKYNISRIDKILQLLIECEINVKKNTENNLMLFAKLINDIYQ